MRRLLFLLTLLVACVGTTGSELVTFRAAAAGPSDAVLGQPLSFTNGYGWSIALTQAKLHIGAVYLNRSVPVSGGQERQCFLPGVYVAQVLGGTDIDVLSPDPQPFPVLGNGTSDLAATGEVWLTGDRVDALDDRTTIASLAGTASRDGESFRFEATITIGRNRVRAVADPARPGANPLCAERIVTPIRTSIVPTGGGTLVVRVDPRVWLGNVELHDLEPVSPGSDLRIISDDAANQPATNLYGGLRSASSGAYRFEWRR